MLPSRTMRRSNRSGVVPQVVVIAILAIIIGIVVMIFVSFGPPRCWHDFTGMTEAQVIDRLGQPFRDSRLNGSGNADEYTLGWHQGFEQGLFMDFKKGVVISQRRVSR